MRAQYSFAAVHSKPVDWEDSMPNEKPTVITHNAHFLKGHASWLYCDSCHKTVGYLCYVTYCYFLFSFVCSCGCSGSVENKYEDLDLHALSLGELMQNPLNKRYCCPKDQSALFSPVQKNLASYRAEVVCKKCNTRYTKEEHFLETPEGTR